MKITRRQLRRIIKEELSRVLLNEEDKIRLSKDFEDAVIEDAAVGSVLIFRGAPQFKKESDGWHGLAAYSEEDLLGMMQKPDEVTAKLNAWRNHGTWESAPNDPVRIPKRMIKPENVAGKDSIDFKRAPEEGMWIEVGATGDRDIIAWLRQIADGGGAMHLFYIE